MKAGVRRIPISHPKLAPEHARAALLMLRRALKQCQLAGACYTAQRVRHAISSAKGAVRAAEYRQARLSR